jgi:hypothetical protein
VPKSILMVASLMLSACGGALANEAGAAAGSAIDRATSPENSARISKIAAGAASAAASGFIGAVTSKESTEHLAKTASSVLDSAGDKLETILKEAGEDVQHDGDIALRDIVLGLAAAGVVVSLALHFILRKKN